METRNHQNFAAGTRLLLVLPLLLLAIVIFSSCAARKKAKSVQTEIAPPPPPPPPPPPSPLNSQSKDNVPVVMEGTADISTEMPFVVVEEMPMFPGGDSTLLSYIMQNTKYPESAKTNKIQGRVIIRFCVNSTGSVDRVSVLKSVSPEIDTEAIRVVSSLPSFIPGRQGGKPVPVWYMVPVNFALN